MSPVIRRLPAYEPPLGITEPCPMALAIPRPRWAPAEEPVPPPLDERHLVRTTLEVLDGRRPPTQLTPLMPLPLIGRLQRRVRPGTTSLLRTRVCHPSQHVAEISATVRRGERVLAVVARAEHNRCWRLTAFDVIE